VQFPSEAVLRNIFTQKGKYFESIADNSGVSTILHSMFKVLPLMLSL
jgi:excinuclease UvrABC nuclease subunit